MEEKIQKIIENYKRNFALLDKGERYKWEALKCYKDNWNIDAENFPEMLRSAFSKTKNLLMSGRYYALDMLQKFVNEKPEIARDMFRNLFDESISFEERCVFFIDTIKQYYSITDKKNHYQDLHAISVYLAFEYPEKYFMYKSRAYTKFRNAIDFKEDKSLKSKYESQYRNNEILCLYILDRIKNDNELIRLHKSRLDEQCYDDKSLYFLAFDILYTYIYIPEQKQEDEQETKNKIDNQGNKRMITKLNTILYGPPGTGKTRHTVITAVAIIENKPISTLEKETYREVLNRYKQYKEKGYIEFTTFHQSYSYEEFIEGIKPVLDSAEDEERDFNDGVKYTLSSGIFKKFCDSVATSRMTTNFAQFDIKENPAIWKVSLESTGDNATRADCLKNGYIRIGWDAYGRNITPETNFSQFGGKIVLNSFINKMQIGDIVLSCYSSTSVDAIGVIIGDYEWNENFEKFKRLRRVKWLAKFENTKLNILKMNNDTVMTLAAVYRMNNINKEDILAAIAQQNNMQQNGNTDSKNYVFIIDEINRGNISKIFGELITLVEESKRKGNCDEQVATLPYSHKPFGIPNNLYILGTMNTADRSIATLDTALRRRFHFVEMLPDSATLEGLSVEGISIKALFETINLRIAALYDREHTIGHAYFMPLQESPTLQTLADIFSQNIIPLLQDYFFDDYQKIRLVLGDNKKTSPEQQFVRVIAQDPKWLFGDTDEAPDTVISYEINVAAFSNPDAYHGILM